STLFPYTTLFRSRPRVHRGDALLDELEVGEGALELVARAGPLRGLVGGLLGAAGDAGRERAAAVVEAGEGDLEPLPFLVQEVRLRHADVRESDRSEEHTSELQSRENLVCRLLLEKKKNARDS